MTELDTRDISGNVLSPDGHDVVYIRTIYRTFYDIIISKREEIMAHNEKTRKGLAIAITGTPRVGKSTFLLYVAHRLHLDNILFVVTIAGKHYNCTFSEVDDISRELKDFSFVHLVDPDPMIGVTPISCALPIFFASPTISNFCSYKSTGVDKLFMPLWEEKELIDAYVACNIKYEKWWFSKWGGVFIDSTRERLMERQLHHVINSNILKSVLEASDDYVLSPDMLSCQWLLHRRPFYNYERCVTDLPSEYVKQKILEKLESGVTFALPITEANRCISGALYQSMVLRKLETKPSDVLFRKLHSKASAPFVITNTIKFSNHDVFLTPADNTLYIPNETNKKGFDALIIQDLVGFVIQITINRNHSALDLSEVSFHIPNIRTWNVCCIYPPSNKKAFHFPAVHNLSIACRYEAHVPFFEFDS